MDQHGKRDFTLMHDVDELEHVISSRRTIHKFSPEPISKEILLKSIEMARWAPNHKLTEPWRFYLVGPETADALARLNAQIVAEKKGVCVGESKLTQWREKPCMVIVTCKKAGDPFREKEDYAATCCAIHNMSLYLWRQGIGMKWSTTGATRDPAFYETMAIDPQHEEIVGLLWCGYPEVIPEKSRKPVGAIVRELP